MFTTRHIRSQPRLSLALLLLILLTTLSANFLDTQAQNADIFVFDQTLDPTGINARAVALGDLDNDGDLDAYLGLDDGTRNKIYINNQGTFTFGDEASLPGSTNAVALGDLDQDGNVDAVVGNGLGEYDLIEYNDGQANLQVSSSVPNTIDTNTLAVELGDIDNDNDLDIIFGTDQSSHIRVNQGGAQGGTIGQFAPGQTLATGHSSAIAVGDLDNDNDQDIVIAINFGAAIQLWINNGGTFQAGVTLPFEPGRSVTDIALGLLDEDNLSDIYIATNGDDLIALNNGSGSFNQGQSLPTGNSQEVALSDVDMDGDLDAVLAVWEYAFNGDQLWLNKNGNFTQTQIFPDSRSVSVATGDIDNNTTPDLLLANLEGPKQVWINQLTPSGSDIAVTLDGVRDAEIVRSLSYIVTLTVHGDKNAENVTMSVSGRTTPMAWLTPTNCSPQDCPVGTLPVNSTSTYTVTTDVLQLPIDQFYALYETTVTVETDSYDPNLSNNTAVFKTNAYNCDLATCLLESFFCYLVTNTRGSWSIDSFETPFNLPMYYQLRDEVLALSSAGQHYRDLYYAHDAELQSLILGDAMLRQQTLSAIQQWEPHLEALVKGEGDTVTISSTHVNAFSSLLFNLSQVASPELQQVIDKELANMEPLNEYVGLTMNEAAEKLALELPNNTIYLPFITH